MEDKELVFRPFDRHDPYNRPKDTQECLVVLDDFKIWHCYFDGYTDSYESPDYCFYSIASFGIFGRIMFRESVLLWCALDRKDVKALAEITLKEME